MTPQFHFYPRLYLRMIRASLPAYDHLQDEVAQAGADLTVTNALDLGCGTGETAKRVLERHRGARMVCVDRSASILRQARKRLPAGEVIFRRQDLNDPLPLASFDLVTSALAIHHLDDRRKRLLFARIARVLSAQGCFVMADVVVPDDPADAVSPLDRSHDLPSRLDDQLTWMREGGLEPVLRWSDRDLVVVVATCAVAGTVK
jgi:tRNA (cmo5U34)-methyltransferase